MAFKPEENIFTISFSELSTFIDCPWRWNLNYYGPGKDIVDDNEYLGYGTAIHHGIQQLYSTSIPTAIQGFKEKLEERFEAINLQHKIKEYTETGTAIIHEFIKTPYMNLKCVAVEYPIMYNLYDNVFFKGFIDLILLDKDKTILVDLKTSKKGWDKKTRESKLKQLQLLLYKHFYNNINENKLDISCDFLLLLGEKKKCESFTINAEEEKTKQSFQTLLDILDLMYKKKKFQFKNINSCRFCRWDNSIECDKDSKRSDFINIDLLLN